MTSDKTPPLEERRIGECRVAERRKGNRRQTFSSIEDLQSEDPDFEERRKRERRLGERRKGGDRRKSQDKAQDK